MFRYDSHRMQEATSRRRRTPNERTFIQRLAHFATKAVRKLLERGWVHADSAVSDLNRPLTYSDQMAMNERGRIEVGATCFFKNFTVSIADVSCYGGKPRRRPGGAPRSRAPALQYGGSRGALDAAGPDFAKERSGA